MAIVLLQYSRMLQAGFANQIIDDDSSELRFAYLRMNRIAGEIDTVRLQLNIAMGNSVYAFRMYHLVS